MCDYPEFYRYTSPIARKDYRCDDCRRVIHKGQQHIYWCGKYGGEMQSARQCNQCATLMQMMAVDFGGDDGCGIAFGELYECWRESCGELPMEVLALSPPAWMQKRQEILEYRKKWYQENHKAAS